MARVRVSWLEEMQFALEDEVGHRVIVDASKAGGGRGAGFTPGRLLLGSVAACGAMDIIAILRKKRQNLKRLVQISGKQTEDYPRYYQEIHIRYLVEGDVQEKALRDAMRLSMEKYCSVGITVSGEARITTGYEIKKL